MTAATELSERQLEVIAAINCGADTEEVAEQLDVSYWTAHKHIKTLRKKLEVKSLLELPGRAEDLGFQLPECDEE